jgi:hypothetical protein
MIRPLDRRSASHRQGNKEAGQKRPGVFAFYDPGPRLQNFTKKICFKSKTLCDKPTTSLMRREFCKSRFLRSQPRRLGPGSAYGRDPDPQTFTLSGSFRSADVEPEGWFAPRNFFVVAGTDLPNSSCAGKTVKQH